MAELKPGWQRVKFGDVVRQVKDKVDPHTSGLDRYVAGEHMDTDDLRIRRWGDIGDDYLGPAFHMRFKPGHVLYGSRRTYLRKVAVANFSGICANTTFVLESADPDVLMPEMLPFLMTTEAFHEHSMRESKGSVNPYVNFSDLAWLQLNLPPMQEQRRILKLLEANLQARECIRVAFDSANTLAESQLLADSELLARCRTASLSDLVVDDAPICYGVVQPGDVVASGIPMIRVCDIDSGGALTDLSQIALVSPRIHNQYRRSRVISGDIIISVVGTIGRVSRVTPELAGSNIARALARVRIDEKRVNPEFVLWLLRSPLWQQKLTADSFETARKTLNLSVLGSMQIPLPSAESQQDFVSRWTAIIATSTRLKHRIKLLMQQQLLAFTSSGLQ